jgi:hypothetical protein
LRCRAHNQYEAVLDFGEEYMARFRREVPRRCSRRASDLEEIDCREITQLDSNPVRKFTLS